MKETANKPVYSWWNSDLAVHAKRPIRKDYVNWLWSHDIIQYNESIYFHYTGREEI